MAPTGKITNDVPQLPEVDPQELTPETKIAMAGKVQGYEAKKIITGVIVSLETGHERNNKNRKELLKSARERFV